MSVKRCKWVELKKSNKEYVRYHDEEWGVPVYDNKKLFEKLCLDGAQAGLSWETILMKVKGYRKAFHRFSPNKMSKMTDKELEKLMKNSEIVRNRLKIYSFRSNAIAFLEIRKEKIDFSEHLWGFVGGKPKINKWKTFKNIPTQTKESVQMSKDLKKRGFKFVGPTICYAFMQAVGMVQDHTVDCFRYKDLA